MARARNIKPGIMDNEVLGVADPLLTLLFERLWMLADRAGRLEDRPLRIRAQVFPFRADVEIDSLLDWLASRGFIDRYEVDGQKCICVMNFLEHQRPHPNELASKLPPSPKETPRKKAERTKVELSSDQGDVHSRLFSDTLTTESLLSDTLYAQRFVAVWAAWLRHRKSIKHPVTPEQETAQLKKLAKEGPAAAIERIERSIANGWRGLWFAGENSTANGHHAKQKPNDRESQLEREIREAKGMPT